MIHLRKALAEDLPNVRSLAERIWPDAYGSIISQEQITYMLDMMYSDKALLHQMNEEGCSFLLAIDDDQAVGFASFSEVKKGLFKLHKLYVLPSTQGTGCGKMLLNEVMSEAKDCDGSSIELQVNKHNKARFFYEKLGFTIAHEAVFDIGGGFVMDDYIMTKPL